MGQRCAERAKVTGSEMLWLSARDNKTQTAQKSEAQMVKKKRGRMSRWLYLQRDIMDCCKGQPGEQKIIKYLWW